MSDKNQYIERLRIVLLIFFFHENLLFFVKINLLMIKMKLKPKIIRQHFGLKINILTNVGIFSKKRENKFNE